MRKIALFIVGLTALCATGCNGVVKTYDERKNSYNQAFDIDTRQLVDDFDKIWLADRQYRLTRWHTR